MADIGPVERYSDPVTRLDRLAEAATVAAETHPEAVPGDQVIVLVRTPVTGNTRGWDSSTSHGDEITADAAVEWLLAAASAICAANGGKLEVVRPGQN